MLSALKLPRNVAFSQNRNWEAAESIARLPSCWSLLPRLFTCRRNSTPRAGFQLTNNTSSQLPPYIYS